MEKIAISEFKATCLAVLERVRRTRRSGTSSTRRSFGLWNTSAFIVLPPTHPILVVRATVPALQIECPRGSAGGISLETVHPTR